MKQKLVILGGGESGVGTAILGQQKGYDVFVSDYGAIKDYLCPSVIKQSDQLGRQRTHCF